MVARRKEEPTQQTPVQTAIDLATEHQRSIVPTNARKLPSVKWKPYQYERASAAQLSAWDRQFSPMAWAMVTGAISGVVTLEGDGETGRETFERLGLNPHRRSGSGGPHVDFFHPGWHVKSLNHKSSAGQKWTIDYPGMDIRADGGICLVAGRNKSGPYIWLRDPSDLETLDILPTDLREMLGLLHAPEEKKKAEPKPEQKRTYSIPSDGPIIHIGDTILEKYLAESAYGRDNACFSMACQYRDNNYPQSEAESYARMFASRVGNIDQHGNFDPFTEEQAIKCIASAYSHAARDPWEIKQSRKKEESIEYPFAYPQISSEEHAQTLKDAGIVIQERIRTHFQQKDEKVLVEAVPPGVGKSNNSAPLGIKEFDLAWIAQRHNMVSQVEALQHYRHIQPCTEKNCEIPHLHNTAGALGYLTKPLHELEKEKYGFWCGFHRQFHDTGSAVYQIPHIKTSHPIGHAGIIIDEINIPEWLPERETTVAKLHADITRYSCESVEDDFLRALQGLLTDIAQDNTPIYGKAIYDALDKKAKGYLTNWLGQLDHYGKTRYKLDISDIDNPNLERELLQKTSVLMPHLVRAFMQELVKWQSGKEWNSLIRIGPAIHGGGYALFITEPLQFTPEKGGELPPLVLLDATADKEIHSRLLGKELDIHRIDIDPAPGMQHVAIRTGKYYGKRSLTTKTKDGTSKHINYAIKACQYILKQIDPKGEAIQTKIVGLISFMDCVDEIGEALGIPEHRRGHYWGIRGSNQLEECSILLLVGTPILRPDDLIRQARAIYRDDPKTINTEVVDRVFTDPRLQHYAEYVTNAELTQAAHRNRPLRKENRIVVSFCMGEIDFLPITKEIKKLPYFYEKKQKSKWDEMCEDIEKAFKEWEHEEDENLNQDAGYTSSSALCPVAKENTSILGVINITITPNQSGIFLADMREKGNAEKDDKHAPMKEGDRVLTPLGIGTFLCIHGTRVGVSIDGCTTGMKCFDLEQIGEIPKQQPFDTGLDELFAGIGG